MDEILGFENTAEIQLYRNCVPQASLTPWWQSPDYPDQNEIWWLETHAKRYFVISRTSEINTFFRLY